jgi:hypothetical protein
MRWSPSLSHRTHILAVAALACAVLFAPSITPCSAAPAAPSVTSTEAAWVPRFVPMRLRHGAIFDPVRDRILVFGGETSAGLTNSVLALGLFGWSQIAVTGSAPVARRSAGVIYDPVRDRLLVFGGSDGTSTYNDVWALSLAGAPHWTLLGSGGALVAPREEHVTVYDAAHDRLVVFGGIDAAGHVRSDGWAFSLSGPGTWSPLGTGGARPLARQSACGAYDPVRDRLLVFGGADSSGTLLSDTWALPLGAGGTWALLPLSTGEPGARARATAAYDASRDQMLVYGGRGPAGLLNNVLALSLAGTTAWNVPFSSSPPPAAREWAAAVVDPARDRLVVAGGGTPGPSSDVSAFALGGTHPWSTLTPSTKPGPFRAAALVHDPVRNRMLLFGGLDVNTATNALWSLDLSNPSVWTRLTPAGTPPGPRGYTTAVYDAARDRVLVFGGANLSAGVLYNDVWALQLAGTPTWQLLTTAGTQPAPIYLHTAILDPVRDRMVVFGGSDGTNFNNVLRTLSLGGRRGRSSRPLTRSRRRAAVTARSTMRRTTA